MNLEGSQDPSNNRSEDPGNQAAHSDQGEAFVPLVPGNCEDTDDHAQKILNNLQRGCESRIQNHSLIIDDLGELGMFGELSEDQNYVTMSFEDVHRLVTTMKMANVILNERVQARRRAKLDDIKAQLDAKHCPNMQALLVELESAKRELTQNHSFQSMGDFEGIAYTLEVSVLFEMLLISRAMNWLACLSIDPDLEVRRGTLLLFSELRVAYSSQNTLHELHFHLHDDKKLLETRVRGAMADLGERLTKAAVAPTGGAIQKRQNIANELKPICALVEEMLEITKRSYGVALTASHMGHIAYVRTQRNDPGLEQPTRHSQARNPRLGYAILTRRNSSYDSRRRKRHYGESQELRTQVQQLQADQRRQTEVLNGLLTDTAFGLPTTVLNDAMPSGQALLELIFWICPDTIPGSSEISANPT